MDPDAGANRDGGGPLDAGCQPKLRVQHRQSVPLTNAYAPVIPSPGMVTFTQIRASTDRILRLELATGAVSRIAEGQVQLIDAFAERTLLYQAREGRPGVWLEESGRFTHLFDGNSQQAPYAPEPRRQITNELAAYCGPDGWSIHALDLQTRQEFGSLVQRTRCQEPLFVEGRNIVHLGREGGGRTAIVHYQPTENGPLPTAIEEDTLLSMPVLFGGRVYHLNQGRFRSKALSASPSGETLTPNPLEGCTTVHASASGVVAACGTEQGAWTYTPAPRLAFHDGERLRYLQSVDDDARMILLPRIGDGFVTWLAYDDPDALCGGGLERPAGHVMAAALPDGPAIELAPILAGCFCCGAQWPEPMLEVRGDTIVFNYDADDGFGDREAPSREGWVTAMQLALECD